MKKITFLLIAVLLTLGLTACDPAGFFYSYDELKENVETIELINYDNPDAKKISKEGYGCSNQRDKVTIPFDFEKMEIIEVLSAEKIDDLIQEIAKVHFFRNWRHADAPNGKCIRIVYKNGDFEIIRISYDNCGYVGSFDADGNVKRFVGSVVSSLENATNYFDTVID